MKRAQLYGGDVPDLILPDHIANWDVLSYWEREVYDSMVANRGENEALWVIGAEHGYLAALWTRLFGTRPVLVEPSPPFWRNIRLTWEANDLPSPAATVAAFAGGVPSSWPPVTLRLDGGWPESAYPDEECPAQEYRYLFNETHTVTIPTTTVDQLVEMGVPAPTSLTCDTEGAEVLILPGARRTLAEHDVKCWLSLHPDLIERDYSPAVVADVHVFMNSLGYHGEHLATDHEEHWLFRR